MFFHFNKIIYWCLMTLINSHYVSITYINHDNISKSRRNKKVSSIYFREFNFCKSSILSSSNRLSQTTFFDIVYVNFCVHSTRDTVRSLWICTKSNRLNRVRMRSQYTSYLSCIIIAITNESFEITRNT